MMQAITDTLTYIAANRIQAISIAGSLFILIFILHLIIKGKLRIQYSIIWLGCSFVFLFLSIFRNILDRVASMLGIYYAPAALFLVFTVAMFFILIQFSVVISKNSDKIKLLCQELALLRYDIGKGRKGKRS